MIFFSKHLKQIYVPDVPVEKTFYCLGQFYFNFAVWRKCFNLEQMWRGPLKSRHESSNCQINPQLENNPGISILERERMGSEMWWWDIVRDNLAGTVTSLMCVCWLHFHAPIGTPVHHMCGKAILRLFCLSNLLSIFMSVCLSGPLQLCFIRLAVDTFLAYISLYYCCRLFLQHTLHSLGLSVHIYRAVWHFFSPEK